MRNLKLKFIMCPIHSTIEINTYEKEAINHPLMQRLRHIMQNDVLHLVFPGATHSRLSHSLGTMHVAGTMLDSIFQQKLNDYCNEGNSITEDIRDSLNYLKSITRLAALSHDLGHHAFSHQFSAAPAIRHYLNNPSTFTKLWGEDIDTRLYPSIPQHIEHEHYSVRATAEILKDINIEQYDIYTSDVLSIMETTTPVLSDKFHGVCQTVWKVLTSRNVAHPNNHTTHPSLYSEKVINILRNIISGEVDCDKADYLARDSHYCGVPYGKVDNNSIIKNLSITYSSEDGWLGLTLNNKAIGILESFVNARYSLFKHVYNHKTSNGFEHLLMNAIHELCEQNSIRDEIANSLYNIEGFIKLTDYRIWTHIDNYAHEHPRSFCAKLLKRQRIRYLGSVDADDTDLDKAKQEFEKHLREGEQLHMRSVHTKFSLISDSFTDIKVLKTNSCTSELSLHKIYDVSEYFSMHKCSNTAFFHAS
ncbi:HD domain-containing protein [Vibrio breoganii]